MQTMARPHAFSLPRCALRHDARACRVPLSARVGMLCLALLAHSAVLIPATLVTALEERDAVEGDPGIGAGR